MGALPSVELIFMGKENECQFVEIRLIQKTLASYTKSSVHSTCNSEYYVNKKILMFRHKQLEMFFVQLLEKLQSDLPVRVGEKRKGEVFKLCYMQRCDGKPNFGIWNVCN